MRKRLERWGRRWLVTLLAWLLGAPRRAVSLPEAPRILVVRLDERLGNLIMTTPLFASLRARFPAARIEVLANHKNAALIATHPAVTRVLPFDKRALLAAHGPLRTPFYLRRQRFDVALDAANPTDPSATQAILVRLSGARHLVGYDHGPWSGLFSAPVVASALGEHEIDMRLALLVPLPGEALERRPGLVLPQSQKPPAVPAPYAVLNAGARLADKRLDAEAYARVARALAAGGDSVLVAYGPSEAQLAREIVERAPGTQLAPPTGLLELGALFAAARRVVSCDTGPMHLAVAVGVPTCGLFVSTEPRRYGYSAAPHASIDTRGREVEAWMPELERWLLAS